MRSLPIIAALMLLTSVGRLLGASASVDTVAAFEAGNKLYEERKFAAAVDAYEKISKTGVAAPALYFNLGNALYKSGQIGRAIVTYQQALQMSPRDADILANLQFARNQVQGPTVRPTRWQKALNRLTLNEWTGLATIGFWLTLLLLTGAQFRPAWKNPLRNAVFATSGVTVVLGICLISAYQSASANLAVVIKPDTIVRNGPFEGSDNAFSAGDGAELLVLDHKGDWLQVTDGNRHTGWVKREAVLSQSAS